MIFLQIKVWRNDSYVQKYPRVYWIIDFFSEQFFHIGDWISAYLPTTVKTVWHITTNKQFIKDGPITCLRYFFFSTFRFYITFIDVGRNDCGYGGTTFAWSKLYWKRKKALTLKMTFPAELYFYVLFGDNYCFLATHTEYC